MLSAQQQDLHFEHRKDNVERIIWCYGFKAIQLQHIG